MNTLYKIIASLLLATISLTASAYDASYYTTSSKLSTGRWAKIKVTTTGMQQITHEQLKDWGFNNPEDVSIFGYGGNILTSEFSDSYVDDLPAQPVYRCDDKIIFYGESDVRIYNADSVTMTSISRNTCATAGYYFVTDAYPGASKTPERKGTPSSNNESLNYHYNTQFIEKEVFNPAKAGAQYFGTDFKQEPEQTFVFEAPYTYEADKSSYRGYINYRWIARMSSQRQKLIYTTDYDTSAFNNPNISAPSTNEFYKSKEGFISIVLRNNGNNKYTTTVSEPSVGYEYAAIDYMSFVYVRQNNLTDIDQLAMVFNKVSTNTNITFERANSDIQFWNINSVFTPFAYKTEYNKNKRTIKFSIETDYNSSPNKNAYVIAFDPNKDMYPVEYSGNVNNQDLHGSISPQMLIITSKPYISYAEELAQAHRDIQGMDVIVADQEAIFNEFSSGTPSVMGYKRLIKMFYDRNPEKFKYVILYGGGSFDNRHLVYGDSNWLLTYQCENPAYLCYATKVFTADSYFGMLNDDFSLNSILAAKSCVAVGRLPILNTSNAIDVNKKLISYLKNPPLDNSRNSATLLADAGDSNAPNTHLKQVEEIATTISTISPKTTITKPYCDLYKWESGIAKNSKTLLVQALNNGQAFLGYAGHGNSSALSNYLYSKSDVIANTYKTPPFVFLSTCNALSFDQNGNGIGEEFILKSDGGAIGIIAAGREVYLEHNQKWYLSFVNQFFTASPGDTHGDVYRKARNYLIDNYSADAVLNALNYNFMGDPAIPMYTPKYQVATTSISGTNISDSTTSLSVYPLANNNIKGNIVDADGNIISDFDGSIYISVYDTPYTMQTLGQIQNNSPVAITLDEKCISQAIAKVNGGQFSTSIVIPKSTNPDNTSRIVYYAVSDDKSLQAAGSFNKMVITKYDESKAIADTDAPIISQLYLDSPENTDGAIVNSSTTLYATIEPDASGLCITDTKLENNSRLVLDGNRSYSTASGTLNFATDGSYSFEFPLENLSDGVHSLTLIIADNAGNRTERTIHFTVIGRNAQATLQIDESPARSEATFSLSHNFKSEPMGRLIVEDASGNTIFSKADVKFPYTWNLNDASGDAVADGVYNCYVVLSGEKQYGSTDKTKLIVVKQ